MPSERAQRQIDRLLSQAEEALAQLDWSVVRNRVQAVLSLDPDNADAQEYQSADDSEGLMVPPQDSAINRHIAKSGNSFGIQQRPIIKVNWC